MDKIKIYKNYGCLANERRAIYTCGGPHPTSVCNDELMVKIPDGWNCHENEWGELFVEAPWGWNYRPDELMAGDEAPYFMGINKDGAQFKVKLEVVD